MKILRDEKGNVVIPKVGDKFELDGVKYQVLEITPDKKTVTVHLKLVGENSQVLEFGIPDWNRVINWTDL